MSNKKKLTTWMVVSKELTDFSSFYLLIKNSNNIFNKSVNIHTNSRFIYHYCKYNLIEISWKHAINNKSLAKYIKECDTVTIFYKDNIQEEDTLDLTYNLAQKMAKRIIKIKVPE